MVEDAELTTRPPFNEERPVTVNAPVSVKEEKVPAPAVRASAPILMAPKFEVMEPESRAPTVVREEVITAEPNVVPDNTDVPLILYDSPDAILMSPDTSRLVEVADVVVELPDMVRLPAMVEDAALTKMASPAVKGERYRPASVQFELPPEPTHVPSMAKHPSLRLMPFP
jgi:hypothetical protein